jgi:mannose-6-phosphate isomerase-like protein (cupin superfamily)/SAM-dependent methyltransferase
MRYTYSIPTSASFTGKGLSGYAFGPLSRKDVEIHYIEVKKGHDTFQISRKITRAYYVLSGSGYFTIDNHKYDVRPGMLVEVPPKVEYSYSGRMTLIAFSTPRWFRGNDTSTKWNPDVVGQDFTPLVPSGSRLMRLIRLWLTRSVRMRIFGKSPTNAYLRLNQALWKKLPPSVTALSPLLLYGTFLHRLARLNGGRAQAFGTFFLRNRPQLELIRALLDRTGKGKTLGVAVLGCSTGAEAYSVAWTIRTARPDLTLILRAVDISQQAVEFAKSGVYSLVASDFTRTAILERMTPAEIEELFDRNEDQMTVKSWVREGISWHIGDVGEAEILETLGPQDMVVANNFLCHMDASNAESCLRNIARLVRPEGYLFVSGIDLDVRTKVASDLGWKPLQELLEEIHDGDSCLRNFWPCHYTGLEPLNKKRLDWRIRYAAAFQL